MLLSGSPLDADQAWEPIEPSDASQIEITADTGEYVLGIDVSHWQGNINWTSVANDGIEFVWAKATQGVNYIDPKWYTNINGANNAGLYAGGYHFATPYTSGVDDAADEASDFYDAVSPYLTDGYLRPVLDLEGSNTLTVTQMSNWVHDFMNTFASLSGGIVPVLYTGTGYATNELNSSVNIYDLWFPLWPANPDFDNPPSAPGIWDSYDLWQYSDSESFGGINPVDGDVFLGSLSQFVNKYVISTVPDDHGDNKNEATAVALGDQTLGELDNVGDTDWFQVTLDGNTDYTIELLNSGLVDGTVRLYSSGLTLLGESSGSSLGVSITSLGYTSAVGDVYYVEVSSSSNDGGYKLLVQETDDYEDTFVEATQSLSVGGSVLGGIQADSDFDYLQMQVTAGQSYRLSLSAFSVFGDPLANGALLILNGSGGVVGGANGANPGGEHVSYEFTADSTGTMYVGVTADGVTGDYLLSLSEVELQIEGDLNGDGFVGVDDLNIVLTAWNQSVTSGDWAAGDPSDDGFVGVDDLNLVLVNWNNGTPPATEPIATSTPEDTPSSDSQVEVTADSSSYILGLDVSQWQGSINWSSVAASGREFVFIRGLDRDGDVDTRFYANIAGAHNAGLVAGIYQFVTPWTDGYNDAVDEATQFANLIAPYLTDGYMRPVIDIEPGPPHVPYPMDLDNAVLTDWVHDYMDTFEALTGVQPLIYTNTYHAANAFTSEITEYDLWVANWTHDPDVTPTGNVDGIWNGYDFWQYTDRDSIPGISGGVDGDVFYGSLSELIAEYGIHVLPDDHGDSKNDATVVPVASQTNGELESAFDTDWFQVTLDGNTDYTIELLNSGLVDGTVRLYSSGLTLLGESSGSSFGLSITSLDYTSTFGDVYYVEVSSSSNSGAYSLLVQETDDYEDTFVEATQSLSVGGSVLGGIQTDSDFDYLQMQVTAGQSYRLSLSAFSVFGDPLASGALLILNGSGGVVGGANGANPGGEHVSYEFTADSTGTMYVGVTADGVTGDYLLSLSEVELQIEGDLNGDGFVGVDDLNIVLTAWNQSVTSGDWAAGDPSDDGFVGVDDLNLVLVNWNNGTPPATEPIATSTPVDTPEAAPAQTQQAQQAQQPQQTLDSEQQAQAQQQMRQGLAIANWQSQSTAVLEDDSDEYAPLLGVWEADA